MKFLLPMKQNLHFNHVTITDSCNGIAEIKYVQCFSLTAVIIQSLMPFIIACFLYLFFTEWFKLVYGYMFLQQLHMLLRDTNTGLRLVVHQSLTFRMRT